MLLPRRLATPRFVALGIALDRAPPVLWLALLAIALLPTWWWMGRRVLDGSDDPLGVLALAALLGLAWTCRGALRAAPLLRWFAAALTGAVLATATQGGLPPLLCALFGLLAFGAALLAFLPSRIASAPVLGLSLLSLPLLASLQFYAGYPLRVVTAEASRWLLMPGFAVGQPAGGRAARHRRRALLRRADAVAGLLHGVRRGPVLGSHGPVVPRAPAGRRRAGARGQRGAQQRAGRVRGRQCSAGAVGP